MFAVNKSDERKTSAPSQQPAPTIQLRPPAQSPPLRTLGKAPPPIQVERFHWLFCFHLSNKTLKTKQSDVFSSWLFFFHLSMKHWKSDFQSFSRRNPFAILKMAETLQMFYYQLCANNVWSFFYIYKVPLRCLTPKKKRKYK